MNSEYADIKYSKELADIFPDADWWWGWDIPGKPNKNRFSYSKDIKNCYGENGSFAPKITIKMCLDVLGEELYKITKPKDTYQVFGMPRVTGMPVMTNESLLHALCDFIIHLKKEGVL